MKHSLKSHLMFTLILLALTISALGVTPAMAAESKNTTTVESLLNADGTLNLNSGYTGAVDVAGYDVTLDAKRGPLFQLAASGSDTWSALAPLSWSDNTIAISGEGDVYVGGGFTNAGGDPNADYIAKWNGTSWSALGTGLNADVNTIAISGTGDLYAGGWFTNAGGDSNADYIAKWNGTSWSALGNVPLNSQVTAIVFNGTDMYVGGWFVHAGGLGFTDYIAKWNGTSWSALGVGLNNIVKAIAISGTDVYAGGNFINANGNASADYIAKFNGTSWSALGGTPLNSYINTIAISGTDVYAGGEFTDAGGDTNADFIAKWDSTSWSALGTTPLNTAIYAIAISGTDVYAGGVFSDAGGDVNADRIAKWSGSAWSALDTAPLNNVVTAITISGTDIYVGGYFTNVGGDPNADYITVFGPPFPTVVGVTSDTADGTFKIGDTIDAKVKFSEIVNVTGTPQLTFETGTTDRTVDYVIGSGTDTLLFNYIVQSGDTSTDLNYVSTLSLTLNSGRIKNAGNIRNANRTLPVSNADGAFASTNNFVIDGILPTVSTFAATTPSTSLNVPITAFTASDTETGVTGYMVTTSATPPTAGAAGWSATAPTTFTVSGNGNHTLYPWVKDGAGNVSAVFASPLTVTVNAVVTPTFVDVPLTYWANSFIERLYSAHITGGCITTPLSYCPDNSVTRAQMAVFLEKGLHGSAFTPPAATGTKFSDVPTSYWAAAWIEALAADGITGGCGNNNYCSDAEVTRAQMAVFLLKAMHGSAYTPPSATGTKFTDVNSSYWAAAWVEQLAAEGITSGCGNGTYCPDSSVTRAQMAVFLVKAFNLP